MTRESATEQAQTPASPPRSVAVVRRRLFVAGTLLTTFVCGGIVGAASMLYFGPSGRPPWPPPNDDPPRRMLTQLQKKLNLNDEQSAEIEKILRDHWEQLEAFRRETFPRIEASFDQMREDVSSALKPEQRPGWDEHFKQMKRMFPPMRRGGPPPHGSRPQ